jgi:hypothetical protein
MAHALVLDLTVRRWDQNPLLKGRLLHSLDLWACFEDTERYVDVSVHRIAGASYWQPSEGTYLHLDFIRCS